VIARPARRRRRRRARRGWIVALLLVAVFALGVALGQALHDNPRPGGTQTRFLTYGP
jgi:hypothetical protein